MVLVLSDLTRDAARILTALDVSYILSPLPSFDHCQPLTDIVSIVFLFYQITVAGGFGCPGSTLCVAKFSCSCTITSGGNQVGGCCTNNINSVNCATGLVCDTSNTFVPGSMTYRCIPAGGK